MRTNDVLINENSSPYLKRLVLMKRAGIELSPKQLKKLSEVVSMVEPSPYHNRIVKMPKPIEEPQSFDDLDDLDELDLQELLDEFEEEQMLDDILSEMGYKCDD